MDNAIKTLFILKDMNLNNHATRFLNSMEAEEELNKGKEFIEKNPLSSSADIGKKFEWAYKQCLFLKEHFDEEKIKNIRMKCACGPEYGKLKKLKDLYNKFDDLNIFVEKADKLNQGFKIEYDGQYLYLIYPQCYCSCVKRIDKPLPKQWCYCTLGYTKRMFEFILDKEVEVDLISSVKLGGEVCKIKVIF